MTDNVIRLRLPFDGPYKISQRFGANPETYKAWGLKGHEGTDWNLPSGTPVLAMAKGIVKRAETVEGAVNVNPYGCHVRLQHDGYETIYAHLSRVDVKLGQQVQAGDVLGLSGNTGNVRPAPTSDDDHTTGAHLHVTFRLNNAPRDNGFKGCSDPLLYIQATIAARLAEWWTKAVGDVV